MQDPEKSAWISDQVWNDKFCLTQQPPKRKMPHYELVRKECKIASRYLSEDKDKEVQRRIEADLERYIIKTNILTDKF